MRLSTLAAAFLTAFGILTGAAQAAPPIEAYGKLPQIDAFTLSDSGERYAMVRRQDGKQLVVVFENGKGLIGTLDTTGKSIFDLTFASENHLLVIASQTTKKFGGYKDYQTIIFNIEDNSQMLLAEKERRFVFFASSVFFMSKTEDPDEIIATATINEDNTIYRALIRTNLNTGRASIVAKGTPYTGRWLVNNKGEPIARSDYNDAANYYQIYVRDGSSWKMIFEEKGMELPPLALLAYRDQQNDLIVQADYANQDFTSFHTLSFDGTLSAALFDTDKREPGGLLIDDSDNAIGVVYSGLRPEYAFFDGAITAMVNIVASQFPNDVVNIIQWTPDFQKFVFLVDGGSTAPAYFLYDRTTRNLGKIAPQYLEIADSDIAPVDPFIYNARDGLAIPAVLTKPKGAKAGDRLPLIVYPHGGPEAYDAIGFAHRAQYFASRGYLVLQPNFRGSAGFGSVLRDAGYGEWGAKMQDDVTDGVLELVKQGWADGDRVCIMGASYGGYSALAGGAYTPDLYKCVISVSGVADLPKMLEHEARTSGGRYSATSSYWRKLIGDRQNDSTKLDAISPARNASNFKAPVLLIHGDADTVVPYEQSVIMERALKSAGKNVKLVKLEGEDHNMSFSETRLQALKEIDAFVDAAIGD